ncbi:hypothetical protein [Bradyrhizobium quebecense]|uniref:Uncharacterized protein n=1 Tax=Bradyrhizobium quebecense TaxID=2748629 RepID=A0ACD3VLP8_9BRAD|nr:hypothetical protein [Bradyrhizobium quebecense]UGY07456.1 hypothetical protein J4P68_0040500 [Bradyrhizobium quebecense]
MFDWIKGRFQKPGPISPSPASIQSFVEVIKKDAAEAGLDQATTDQLIATLLEGFGE